MNKKSKQSLDELGKEKIAFVADDKHIIITQINANEKPLHYILLEKWVME